MLNSINTQPSLATPIPKHQIIVLKNTNNHGIHIGDVHNIEGVAEKLHHNLLSEGIPITAEEPVHYHNTQELNSLITKIANSSNNYIIVGNGAEGAEALSNLKNNAFISGRIKTIYTGAEMNDGLEQNLHNIDGVILPCYATNFQTRLAIQNNMCNLIQTAGVPHSITAERMYEGYQKVKNSLPKDTDIYIGVAFGGDTKDFNTGEIREFSSEEARLWAKKIIEIAKEKEAQGQKPTILLVDGPRTKNAATMAFLDEVKKSGISWRFSSYLVNNNHIGLLGAAAKVEAQQELDENGQEITKYTTKQPNDNLCFVAGDSMSLISEVGEFMPNENFYIVKTNSMRPINHQEVDYWYDNGLANLMEIDTKHGKADIIMNEHSSSIMLSSPTEQAARTVISNLIMKQPAMNHSRINGNSDYGSLPLAL